MSPTWIYAILGAADRSGHAVYRASQTLGSWVQTSLGHGYNLRLLIVCAVFLDLSSKESCKIAERFIFLEVNFEVE
jgi:hypothetical protein